MEPTLLRPVALSNSSALKLPTALDTVSLIADGSILLSFSEPFFNNELTSSSPFLRTSFAPPIYDSPILLPKPSTLVSTPSVRSLRPSTTLSTTVFYSVAATPGLTSSPTPAPTPVA
jgi:hypothetical protein